MQPGLHVGNIAGPGRDRREPAAGPLGRGVRGVGARPVRPGRATSRERWGGWLRLYDGALEPERTDALLGRHDTEQGSYGTRSGALVALPADPARTAVYDWSPTPWDVATWAAAQSRLPEPDGVIG